MDSIRRAIATFSIVAILSSFVVSTASAEGTFKDVKEGTYYYDAIEALVDLQAVYTTAENYNPAVNLTRSLAAKYVVVAAGWTLEEPATPTFTDVPKTHPEYKYIETAVAHKFMNGYADSTGKATGKFGPGDTVNRAQYAKMVVETFELPEYVPTAPTFTDAKDTAAWYYKYVETAAHFRVVKGKTAKTFGPNDLINRADGAVMTFRATTAEVAGEGEGEGEGEVGTGALDVSLSDDSPTGLVLPASATAAAVVAFDVTAGDKEVTFNGFTVHKKGVGTLASDFQAYLYDGNDRLTAGKSINSSTNNIEFSNVGLTVGEGETKTITVKVDIGTTATSGVVEFELVDADAVKSTADSVTGDFPLVSDTISISATPVGSITIAKNGSVSNPKVGEVGATVAKFKLTAATEAAKVEQLGLYITGTISAADVTNLKLYVSGETEPLATVDAVNSKDLAQFVFDTPYEIEKGGTKSFYVTADMEPGRNGDTLRIYIDENTDVVAIGGTYGFGMSVTKGNYDNGAADGTDASWSTLEGGDITFVSSGPTAADIAVNAKDVHLLDFTITAVNNVTFKNFEVGMIASVEATAAGGLLNSTTANFTDIKVINTESGETLMGPVDVTSFKTASGGSTAISEALNTDNLQAYYLFTDEFSMDAGETLKLALTTDVANNTSLNNETLIASLQIGGTYPQVKDVNNKTLTNSSSLVPSTAIIGKTMTVKSPSLTLSLASTPVAGANTKVKGVKAVKFGGLSFACGSASSCKVTDITLSAHLDDNANNTWDAGGVDGYDNSVYANAYVGSVSLQDASGNVVAAAKSVQSTGAVVFTNLAWALKAGETQTVYVVGDITTNATTSGKIAFAIDATSDVTAEDADGNTISSVTGTPNSNVTTNPNGTWVAVSSGGALTVSVDASTPKENIVVAGTADQAISKFKFSATSEPFVVTKLAVNNRQSAVTSTSTLGDYDNNVFSVKISYTNSTGATETKTGYLTNGTAEFSGMDFFIGKDDDAVLTVYATLNTIIGGATAAEFVDLNLAFENFNSVAQDSGVTRTAAVLDAYTAKLSLGTLSFTDSGYDTNDAAGQTVSSLDATQTITIDGGTKVFTVGTLLFVDAGANGTYDSGADSLFVTTASWSAPTPTVKVINDADASLADNLNIYYALPGTGYLTDSNQMVVYESKPTFTLAADSPSGDRSPSASDTIFKFTVAATSQEKVQFRQESSVLRQSADSAGTKDVGGGADVITVATDTTFLTEGTGSNSITFSGDVNAAEGVYWSATAGTFDVTLYPKVSFWVFIDPVAHASTAVTQAQLKFACGAGNITDHTVVAGAGTSDLVTADAGTGWMFFDVVNPCEGLNDTRYAVTVLGAVAITANGDVMYVDNIRFHATTDANDVIQVTLSSDASMNTVAPNVKALLKEGGTTLAEGSIYMTSASAATISFFPYTSNYTNIEIAKGSSRTFSVVADTTGIITDTAQVDDKLTPSISLGTSTNGSVTAGRVKWYETNAQVTWCGAVDNNIFTGNTLKY